MKKFIFITIIIFSGVAIFPYRVSAADPYGIRATADTAGLNTSQGTVSDVAGNVIGAGLTLVGVLFFLLMIYAGITWMLARGNEEQSKKALNTITAAIIGLVLVIASYAITRFVFQSVSGGASTGPAAGGESGCCVRCAGAECTRTYIPNNVSTICAQDVQDFQTGITSRVEYVPE